MKKLLLVLTIFLSFNIGGLAQTNYDSLRQEVNKHGQDTNRVLALNKLSRAYERSNYDSAILLAKQALALSEELQFEKGIAYSLHHMGNAYLNTGDMDSADQKFLDALVIYEKLGNKKNSARMYNNLGMSKRNRGSYPEAVELFLKSLRIMEEVGSPRDIAVAYQNTGIVFAIQHEFETAEAYMFKATEILKESGDSTTYYGAVMDYSSLKRSMGNYSEAIRLLTKAYKFYIRTGNKTSEAICTYNLGYNSYDMLDKVKSLEYFNKAKNMFIELGNGMRIVGCHLKIAEINIELGNYAIALQTANECVPYAKKHGSFPQRASLQKILSQAYAGLGRYKLALEHQLSYEQIQDSLDSEDQSLKMLELQNKYDQEVSKREIAELKVENEQNEQKARRQTIQSYVLIGLIIIIMIFVFLLFNQFRIKQRSNNKLKEKNEIIQRSLEEKEVLLREIHHRVQNNLQFVSSMLNLQARRVEDPLTLEILKGCKLRIQSMALIHQKLYQESDLKGIDISNYIHNLMESLRGSYNIDSERISTEYDVEPLYLDINSAIPIGLILNELITNAYKYAFDGMKDGLLYIGLKEVDQTLILTIRDNGKGLPKDFSVENSQSFGLKLVNSLAKKIKASLEFSSDNGTTVVVSIKEYERL